MQTLQELASLQFVWPSPLQANLGEEGQESRAGQIYELIPGREIFNGICEEFAGSCRQTNDAVLI